MNLDMRKILTAAVILFLVDLPWLMVSSPYVKDMVAKIQGSPLRFEFLPAIPVYLALGYLIQKAETVGDAFLMGLATYAVYDFTNLATLKNYSLAFALVDSLWGGILFSIVKLILDIRM